MQPKFYNELLTNPLWRIKYHGRIYTAGEFCHLVYQISNEIKEIDINYDRESYFIAVGYHGFEYFLYILLASYLGINLILCDPKMLGSLLNNYQLNYALILTSRNLPTSPIRQFIAQLETSGQTSSYLPPISERQAQLIFFTSGTTSLPKLVLYQEAKLLRNARVVGQYLQIRSTDKCLCMFPVHYMYGFSMTMATLLYSGEILFERATLTAHEIWSYLKEDQLTLLPTIRSQLAQMQIMMRGSAAYFEHLKILNASDRIYVDQVADVLKICPVFWNNFGQTESGPRLFALEIAKSQIKRLHHYSHRNVIALGSVIDPDILVSIYNDHDEECAVNEVGELHYCTPFAMEGYIDSSGLIRKKSMIHSGDLIYKDSNDCIYWVGRKDETIKIDGKYVNIGILHQFFEQWIAVEGCYFTHCDEKGLIACFVQKDRANNEQLKNIILQLYRQHFPNYPRLRQIVFMAAIPTTLSGKVKYKELREQFQLGVVYEL